MINTVLKVDDICNDCPYFSPETTHATNYDNDMCNHIRKRIKKITSERNKICDRCIHDGEQADTKSSCHLCRNNPKDTRINWFEEKEGK